MPNDPADVTHVSAIICTRNRGDKIATAVNSVLACDYPSFDLTIIDQSTDDLTRDAVAELAAAEPRLQYVHSTEPGLSKAYNNGINRSTGEIIVFTDDDCIVEPDWITTIVDAFGSEPDGDLLYGRVVAAGQHDSDERLTPALEIPVPERLAKGEGFKVFGMGANFAARRRLFTRAGTFDEMLGGGGPLWSSQDYDLEYRAYQAGCVILLRPEVVVRHDGRREWEDWPNLLLAYGSGDGAFYMKHVRCGDVRAAWLLAGQLWHSASRFVGKLVLVRGISPDRHYFRGLVRGARASFKFAVDRRTRLYVERG
jgi:glycosyltransferase involved in cell wall biosynthesis